LSTTTTTTTPLWQCLLRLTHHRGRGLPSPLSVLPIPWRDVTVPAKLSFAVLYDDEVVRPDPPTRRGLKELVAALEDAGHDVVSWSHDKEHWQAGEKLFASLTGFDGGENIRNPIFASGEPWAPGMDSVQNGMTGQTARDLWPYHMERTAWQKRLLEIWTETANRTKSGQPVDALLCPVHPTVSAKHGQLARYYVYTSNFNLSGGYAGVCPLGRLASPRAEPVLFQTTRP
jgi:amidase